MRIPGNQRCPAGQGHRPFGTTRCMISYGYILCDSLRIYGPSGQAWPWVDNVANCEYSVQLNVSGSGIMDVRGEPLKFLVAQVGLNSLNCYAPIEVASLLGTNNTLYSLGRLPESYRVQNECSCPEGKESSGRNGQ